MRDNTFPCRWVCAQVVSQGFVVVRIRDHRAIYHEDITILAQVKIVLLETVQEPITGLAAVVRVTWCQRSWLDPGDLATAVSSVIPYPKRRMTYLRRLTPRSSGARN